LINSKKARDTYKKMVRPETPQSSGKSRITPDNHKQILNELLKGYEIFQDRVGFHNSRRDLRAREVQVLADLQCQDVPPFTYCNWTKTKKNVEIMLNLANTVRWSYRRYLANDAMGAAVENSGLTEDYGLFNIGVLPVETIHPFIQEIFFDFESTKREISWFKEIQKATFPERKYPITPHCLNLWFSWQIDCLTLYQMGDPKDVGNRIKYAIKLNPGPCKYPLDLYRIYVVVEADINLWEPNIEKHRDEEIWRIYGID
jgi:hypothetical protein